MTDQKDNSPKDAGKDGGQAKRPHATLDLRAVEIKNEPAAGSASAKAPESPVTPASAGPAAKTAEIRSSMKASQTQLPPPPPRPSAAGRMASHLLAGLAGGVIALAGGDWITRATGIRTAATTLESATADLNSRLAAIEKSAGDTSLDAVIADRLASAEAKLNGLAQLSADITAIKEAQAAAQIETKSLAEKQAALEKDTKTSDRLTKLEADMTTLVRAAGSEGNSGEPIPQLAAINGKLNDLESALKTEISTLRNTLPQNLETRLGSVGEESATAKSAAERIDREVSAVKSEAARIAQSIEGLKSEDERLALALTAAKEEAGKATSAASEVREGLDSQAKTFAKSTEVKIALTPVSERIAKIEENLDGVIKTEDERRTNAERVVISLELANLKRAIDRGGSFAAELDAVRSASPKDLDFTTLEKYKSGGAPSLATLQRESKPAINAMLDAALPKNTGSVLDKLIAGAKTVVRIRKVGSDPKDTSPEAIVDHIEVALQDGRLDDIATAAKDLPPASANAAKDWLARIDARASVDTAISAVEAKLKTAFQTPSGANEPAAGPETGPDKPGKS